MPEACAPLLIEVISDFVCPWCWIGKRGVDALASERSVERLWRPYFLHPGLPDEGMDRKQFVLMKFGPGGVSKAAMQGLYEAADAVGLSLNYDAVTRVPNTTNAHRLAHWATGQGVGDPVAEGLFQAYFADGRDIGAIDVLVDIGTSAGMDADLLRNLLAGDADMEDVSNAAEQARDLGISGVPTHLIDRKAMIVGAQGVAALREAAYRVATT
ncbi:MAG: DsbA family oxidoreductase [Pacificimonas sp.]